MKLKICFLLLLCQNFSGAAQNKLSLKPLSIGDKMPDLYLEKVADLNINGKLVSTLRLSQFKGKMLILDFWATWCSPCRGMIPVMDSLQRVFNGKVQFLPVTYQSAAEIAPIINSIKKYKPFNLPEVTGDKILHVLFPHRTLPHYVWIDGLGIVRAITESKDITAANIRRMLKAGDVNLAVKKDSVLAYESSAPLFYSGNGGNGEAVKYHSVLSGYVPGLKPGLQITPYDTIKGQRFIVRNVPFIWLCRLAYGEKGRHFSASAIRILSKDSLSMNSHLEGKAYDNWLATGNAYTYELMVPPSLSTTAYPMMQQDLLRLFPAYHVMVDKRVTRCLVMVRTTSEDLLHTKGGSPVVSVSPYACHLVNSHLNQLFVRLQHQYLQNYPYPVIDESGYTDRVDMDLEGKLFDVASLNLGLKKYGLAMVIKDAAIDMLVIQDNPPAITANSKP